MTLAEENNLLLQQLAESLKQNETLIAQLGKLQSQIDLLLHKLYGKKSEKQKPKKDLPEDKKTVTKVQKGVRPKKQTEGTSKGRDFPESLPRTRITYDLTEEEKQYLCGRKKHCIGKIVTEQLDVIPTQLIVKEHVRYKYTCRCGGCGIDVSTMPSQPIEKGIPGPGLLADVIISKYQDAMPLYRQMLRFRRQHINIPDNTLCNWIEESALLLSPLYEAMKANVLKDVKIHTDDTPVPVLTKGKNKLARLWVYVSEGIQVPPCTVYDYTPTRSKSAPMKFLQSFEGYLQADAYPGYDTIYRTRPVYEVGCMAHARRKFHEVAIAAGGDSHAHTALEYIQRLYQVEKISKHMSRIDRYYYRKKYAKPILKNFKRWLNRIQKTLLPKTPICLAIGYAQNHWRALERYLADGCLSIDNNAAERAIRPIAIGRKNWLFAGSHEGGKRAAILYSMIETCKQYQINVFDYLKDVLARIPNTKQRDLSTLLPYNWRQSENITA